MGYTDEEIAAEETDTPAFVNESTEEDDDVIVGEDVSGASTGNGNDTCEAAKKVTMVIKKAVIDSYTPKGEDDWQKKSLALTLVIGPEGINGKGRYKGKHFFPRIGVALNRKEYDFSKNAAGNATDWYVQGTGGYFGEYNEILKALGFSTNPAPDNNQAFRKALVGRQLSCDITLVNKQAKDSTGKYVDVDEKENKLINFKAVKVAAPELAEAAAE